MEELEREYLISCYDKRVGFLGKTPAALGWSEKGQAARYEAALGLFGFESLSGFGSVDERGGCAGVSCPGAVSLADYGCGMGDFYGFLLRKGISGIDYSGFDINPGLIGIARTRYLGGKDRPEKNGDQKNVFFDVLDIDSGELPGFYDYSLICGVFNQRVEGASEAAKRCIEKMWRRTRRALVFDALSDKKDMEKDAALEYYGAREMLEFAARKIPAAKASVHEDLVEGSLILCLRRE